MMLRGGSDEFRERRARNRGLFFGNKNFLRLDGDNFGGGKFGGTATDCKFVSISDELVSGDGEALPTAKDDIFRAGRLREEEKKDCAGKQAFGALREK